MAGYDHTTIDGKWQKRWADEDTFATPTDRTKPKYYVLDMFPYPSGSGLHVGHPKGYVATDVIARARRMMGYNVLRVMGWDSFGLPSERQAVREGIHPREVTERNVAYFKEQLTKLGLSYDWSRELATSDPGYYKWTQWIFRKLYEKGLAYQAEVPVNWCPALGTVLANEEVTPEGTYKETGDPVEKRLMKQWMLRITDYADRLIDGLEGIDWPDSTYKKQLDWIGRSTGAEIEYKVADSDHSFSVFTTRPDTLFGCTYVVLAPEHALVSEISTGDNREAVEAYVASVGRKSERDRISEAVDAVKTGVFTGAYAINPVNGAKVPIWIADYVLATYGTGAVFACPAHDVRDHAFALQFELPIIEVVSRGEGGKSVQEAAYLGDGPHVNSELLDGLDTTEAKTAIIKWLEANDHGKGSVNFKLRDWLFSRQRYWGEPFPIIETESGEVKLLPESELPVELPELTEFKPTDDGRPPLARAQDWIKTTDPETGEAAIRETNTMPQWAGSCWYYLRFLSPHRDDVPWDAEEEKYWMPVDLYVGGSEHAVLHLMYARFWHQVLYDIGAVSTPEPFKRLFHQGMIHAMSYRDPVTEKFYYPEQVEERDGVYFAKDDGAELTTKIFKMSKSRYNVVNPDDMCAEFGADAMRLYELFMGPLEDGIEWETSGVAGTRRFLDRFWRLVESDRLTDDEVQDPGLERVLHLAIKKVTDAIENMRFNTAIAEMMVFVNEATKAKKVPRAWLSLFVRILGPFAPHLGEEVWERLGNQGSFTFAPWPVYDEAKLKVDTVTVAVQVMGKLRATIDLPADHSKQEAIDAAKAHEKVIPFLDGKTIRREIYVPGRLVNIVAN